MHAEKVLNLKLPRFTDLTHVHNKFTTQNTQMTAECECVHSYSHVVAIVVVIYTAIRFMSNQWRKKTLMSVHHAVSV